MAKKLNEFTFRSKGKSKYPIDKWFDGSIWRLERGVDFQISVNNIRNICFTLAHKNGLGLRTGVVDDNTLVIQAYSLEAEGE